MRIPVLSGFQELETPHQRFLIFVAFNVVSWQNIVGPARVLQARKIDMPEAFVGMLLSFLPFTALLLLVTMPLVTRFGPKRVMLWAWFWRNVICCLVFALPLALAFGGKRVAWAVLMTAILGFCVMRALGSGGWLPWLHEIVAEDKRSTYFSTETALTQIINVAIMLAQAVLQLLEAALAGPAHKGLLHRLPRRIDARRQAAPGSATAQHVAAGIDHGAAIVQRGAPPPTRRRLEEIARQRPFGIGQSCMAGCVAVTLGVAIARGTCGTLRWRCRRALALQARQAQRLGQGDGTGRIAAGKFGPGLRQFGQCGLRVILNQSTQRCVLRGMNARRASCLGHVLSGSREGGQKNTLFLLHPLRHQ